LDYKFLKKIISSLAANRPASEAAVLALGVRPVDASPQVEKSPLAPQTPQSILNDGPGRPPLFPASEHDEDRGPDFAAHKAAFFFKLERELEKVWISTGGNITLLNTLSDQCILSTEGSGTEASTGNPSLKTACGCTTWIL
jgi:hypothetical protein